MYGKDVRLKSLSVVHGDITAVYPTDLEIASGEILALLGPSGAGKTSLLRALAGFLAPGPGRVLIGGADVTDRPPERRPTAMVFPGLALFPLMSVADNVGFGLEARGLPRAARRARSDDLLALVGLTGHGDRRPDDLGDADRLRLAIARALAVEPAVLLLDEPLAALDPEDRRRMRAELRAIRHRTGVTVVHATADRADALALADRVAVIHAGRLEQVDTPDRLYSRPATAVVARLVGDRTIVRGRVATVAEARVAVDTAIGRLWATARGALTPGDAVAVTIRPERLLLEAERGERGLAAADTEGWNRLTGDLVGRTLEGAIVAYDFALGDVGLVMHRPNLGQHDLLLPSLHAIGFHADDATAFAEARDGGGGDG